MYKKIFVILFIIMMMFFGFSPSLALQESSPGQPAEGEIIRSAEGAQETASEVQAFRSSRMIGSVVQNPQGEQLGTIQDLIIDTESGQILFGVLSCCGFLGLGEDLFAIPWELFIPKPVPGIFILDVSADTLKEAPGFPPDQWPAIGDHQWGSGIYQYYGYSPRQIPGAGYGYGLTGIEPQAGGWGIATPYGREFNPETVQTFQAEVIRIDRFVPMTGMSEGVELIVDLEGSRTEVHLGPSWYLRYQDFEIQAGDTVEVTGSRIELGGIPIVIATRIVSPEVTLNLRNELGYPVWSAIPPMESAVIEGQEAVVNIYEYLFIPGAIEVSPGTKVTWTNHDIAPHIVTSGIISEELTGETFKSPELQFGEQYAYTFTEPGEYPYFCSFHPNMTGRVSVSE